MYTHPDIERMNAALLSEAIYKDHPHEFLEACNWCSIDGLACSAIQDDSLHFGIASDNNRNTIYIVVRGTVDWKNWSYNLTIPRVYSSSISFGAVHSGFLSYAERLPLDELMEEHERNGKRIVLCGHSLGGAVASIATAIMLKMCTYRKSEIVCYTFGSPMFASADFADELKKNGAVGSMEHWINPNDVVPRILGTCPDVVLSFLNAGVSVAFSSFVFGDKDGLASTFKGLTKRVLKEIVDSCGKFPTYVPVGNILDNSSSSRGKLLPGDESVCRPVGLEELSNVSYIRHNHDMSNYVYDMKKNVRVNASDFCSVENCSKWWKPQYIDKAYRTGFDDNGIRLEMIGHRFGLLQRLSANDVLVGGKRMTKDPLLIATCSHAISYYLPLAGDMNAMSKTKTKVEISFKSLMTSSVAKRVFEVSSTWFEDRESKISTGSMVDLLAHLRASVLLSDPQNMRNNRKLVDTLSSCESSDHDASTSSKSEEGNHSTTETPELVHSVHKMDKFVQKQFKEQDKVDLVRIFEVLQDHPEKREILLNEITMTLISSMNEEQGNDDENYLDKLLKKYEVESSPYRRHKFSPSTKSFFKLPKASEVLSVTKTATVITQDIFLFEAASTYIILNRWKELLVRTSRKKNVGSPRKFAKTIALAGVASFSIAFFLYAMLGPAAVASVLRASYIGLYLGGMTSTAAGTVSYLFTFFSRSRGFMHASSALTEKFVLSTLLSCDQECSLQEHEDSLFEWVDSIDSNDSLWNEKVSCDILKNIDHNDRQEIISFVKSYVTPTRLMRQNLMKRRTFTVAIMGEPGSGKTTFLNNAFRACYEERTAIQKSHVMEIKSRAGILTKVTFLDFPGMNGNDEFVGSDVENLTALLPAIDCVLFFTKLNSRCFLAEELMGKVRGSCKVRIVLTHVDTELQNKYCVMVDEVTERHGIEEEEIDERSVLGETVESLMEQKKAFTRKLNVPEKEAELWVPRRSFTLMDSNFQDVLKPHLRSTVDMKKWISSFVY